MAFWENVDNELKYKNISRKELAAKIGFAVSGISLGIKNGNCPSADVAYKIAKELNVTVEYLVTGNEKENEENKRTREIKRISQEMKQLNSHDIETISMLVHRFL